jgi:hypothetical protein
MARRSRAKKPGAREPNGRLQRQSVDQIKAVARGKRYQYGANRDNVDDGEWSTAIGRAYKWNLIKKHHLQAAEKYVRICVLWSVINNVLSPFPKSPALMFEISGKTTRDFPDDFIRENESKVQDAINALKACGNDVYTSVDNVCRLDIDCGAWPAHQLASLTIGLDALVDLFGIQVE